MNIFILTLQYPSTPRQKRAHTKTVVVAAVDEADARYIAQYHPVSRGLPVVGVETVKPGGLVAVR